MKKKTINKKKISKECWGLDSAFLKWLKEHLIVYLKEASKVVDLNWYKFQYKGEELTQEQIIKKMLILLNSIEGKDIWDGEEYTSKCDEILDLWKLVFHSMWW